MPPEGRRARGPGDGPGPPGTVGTGRYPLRMADPDTPAPRSAPAPGRRPLGAVLVPVAATLLTLLTLPALALGALFGTEPPECFMTLTDTAQAQCEAALRAGHDLTPAVLSGVLAVVQFGAFAAVWALRRRTVPRWTLLGVVAAIVLLFFLLLPAPSALNPSRPPPPAHLEARP